MADSKPKTCACGCGKRLDMVGAGNRKYWYGHEKIGPDNFWFYFNHPPDCLCGCGEPASWDDTNLIWGEFKKGHERRLSEEEKNKTRRKRRRKSAHQRDLFLMNNASKTAGKKR